LENGLADIAVFFAPISEYIDPMPQPRRNRHQGETT
jgi:hypothetical protein